MTNKIEKWDKEVHFYDKLNGRDLEEHIVRKRLKSGLKSTICVYMIYEVYENLTKHNNDFIQFLEDMPIPNAPNNSPNKVEFYNGAAITKNIILKKLKSLPRE